MKKIMFVSREIFGKKNVQIQIPNDVFPSQEQIDHIDKGTGENCQHGWFKSVSDGKAARVVNNEDNNNNDSDNDDDDVNAHLHYRCWLPPSTQKDEVKGIVIFHHGIQSQSGHSSRIDGRPLDAALLVDTFTSKGIAVYSMDQYGHGFSEGKRFFLPSWKDSRDDFINFTKLVAAENSKSVPLFLSGESFGGTLSLLVSRYFQDHPDEAPSNFDSSLLICPAIIGDVPGFPVYQLLRYVLAPISPTWTPFFMPNTVSPERIWKDPKVCEYYTDPQKMRMQLDCCGSPFRLGTAVNMLKALEDVCTNTIPGYDQPFCVLHGDEDVAVPIVGSHLLFDNCSTLEEHKEFHVIQSSYHGILADPKAEEAMKKLVNYVDARMKKFVAVTSTTTTAPISSDK